ncbi:alpha/beta fold hydrolase [Salinispira pacifica]|uniref:Hydrolase, alpha/beta fold family protein n=1 Tax=Salinispira pacifica TaxID=1307761 RepID=V5WHB2_9SPIO|nr:alpha/beta hydrolase [Salinispira pacifica]AHC14944.1 Hydrolase, alpha/beta fold family protein [Salinispira pacifica]
MKLETDSGQTINYQVYGSREHPPLILIHGLGAEISSWKYQIEEFPRHGFFVIAVDMYGHGESENIQGDALHEWNEEILELLKQLELSSAVLCGVSMGGVIALNFSCHYPQHVSGLIISDSFAELNSISERALGFSQVLGFALFSILGRRQFAKGMASAYKAEFASSAREYMYARCLQADFTQLIRARRGINRIRTLNCLGALEVPALITVGSGFGSFFVNINRKIAEALPSSTFRILENSMDPSPLVNPGDFNREAVSFLRQFRK